MILVESGIGKVNAAVAATLVIERCKPDVIINTGTSGAFAAGLNVSDVIVATQYVYGDVDATCSPSNTYCDKPLDLPMTIHQQE